MGYLNVGHGLWGTITHLIQALVVGGMEDARLRHGGLSPQLLQGNMLDNEIRLASSKHLVTESVPGRPSYLPSTSRVITQRQGEVKIFDCCSRQ